MTPLQNLDSEILLFDGATGTFLQQLGLTSEECPELWNDTHPEKIKKLYQSYKDAGSRVIQTNTFGANRLKLKKFSLESRVEELNRKGVELAKEVMGSDGFVSASIGPTGDFLAPYGTLSLSALYDIYREQVTAAAEAGADVINIETMMDISEARIALLAALENTSLPVICSFTFEKQGKTLMGNPPQTLVYISEALGASVVGANCSGGPAELLPIIKEMKKHAGIPLIAQPNAGLPHLVDGRTTYRLTPEEMAVEAAALAKAGANIIGGCCGTTPEHIRLIRKALLNLEPVPPTAHQDACICSKYQISSIEKAKEALLAIQVTPSTAVFDILDLIMEVKSEMPVPLLRFDPSMSPAEVEKAVQEIESMVKNPLAFQLENPEQAAAALRSYCGLAGVISRQSQVEINHLIQKYGAAALE